MRLDTRSQMAVNLCSVLNVPNGEKFRQLGRICVAWGWDAKKSLPLAIALRDKLGLSDLECHQVMTATVDGQEIKLSRMN